MELHLTRANDGKSCCNISSRCGHLWNVVALIINADDFLIDRTFLYSLIHYIFGGHALQMQFQNYHTTFNSLLSAAAQITHS
jgi:hypothetical protein